MANIMIQGTTSSAGKSLMCTGLCRIFKEDGYRVYPFKSQNMSSTYHITPEGYMMSTAQALQGKAAGVKAHPNMNPILLKPTSDKGSKVIIMGEEKYNMEAIEYFNFRKNLKPMITDIFRGLEKENEIIVIEGAGGPAEINLKENDIVNMGMAEIADSPVLLIADIHRGGVFASLYGTVMLLEEHERQRIKGLIINKFRGDKTLLDPGIEMIQDILNIPVVGTIPFVDLDLSDETEEEIEKELNKLSKIIRDNMDMKLVYSLLGISHD